MEFNTNFAGQSLNLLHQERAARNELFGGECLKKIRAAPMRRRYGNSSLQKRKVK